MVLDVKSLTEATSGAVGGALSTSILYPLDTCKTKFQAEAKADGTNRYRNLVDVFREAVACGKLGSLYQGLATKNGHALLSGFVYFYSYSYIKTKYLQHSQSSKMGTLANLIVAAAAGACTCCVTQPLDTLSSRMQTSNPGEAKSLVALLREGGIKHAYDGIGISLILTCNPAIQYTVFEQLKNRVLDRQQAKMAASPSSGASPLAISAFTAFVLGAVSKCVATVITYPLIRCKVMMQRACTPEEEERRRLAGGDVRVCGPPSTMLQALSIIWHSEGVAGLYKGLEAQILKTVLSAALMLMIKEKVADGSRSTILALDRLLSARKVAAVVQSQVIPTVARPMPGVAMSASATSGFRPSIRVVPVQVHHGGHGVGTQHLLAADEGAV